MCKSCSSCQQYKNARVGIVGESFKGMGDFAVPAEILKDTIGIETISFDYTMGQELADQVSEEDISQEMKENEALF